MDKLFYYFEQFQKLSSSDKEAIKTCCTIRKVNKHDILEEVGTTSRTLYFVKSGAVRIFYYKGDIEVTEYFALSNSLVTRVRSMLTQKVSLKGIQILETAELVAINSAKFFKLCDSSRNIERLFRLLLEASLLDVVERLESIQFHSAQERYNNLIENHHLLQKVPLKYIASYLGITQVSLSRIRANHSNSN